MTYTFNGQPLSQKKFDTLKQLGEYGKMGMLGNSGPDMITQVLMAPEPEESPFNKLLNQMLGGGQAVRTPQQELSDWFTQPLREDQRQPQPQPQPQPYSQDQMSQDLNSISSSDMNFSEKAGAIRALSEKHGIQPEVKEDGFLMGLGKGITKPFRSVGDQLGSIAQVAYGTGRDVLNGDSILNAFANNPIENTDRFLVNEQERDDMWKDPLLQSVKNGVGIASFGIPGGGSLGQAVGRGTLSGAAFGFGGSRPGEEISQMLMGGVGGGAGGGAGYGLSKIGSKIFNKGGDDVITKFNRSFDKADDTIASQGISTTGGQQGVMGDINPMLNYLSGDESIINTMAKKGFNPTIQEKSQLAQHVLNQGGDRVPDFLKRQLDDIIMRGGDDAAKITVNAVPLERPAGFGGSAPVPLERPASFGSSAPAKLTPTAKLANKLQTSAKNNITGQLKRELGTPPVNVGGLNLYDDAAKITVNNTPLLRPGDSIDDILSKTDDIFKTRGPIIQQTVDDLTNKGVKVDLTPIRKRLIAEMDDKLTAEAKAPLQKAINSLDGVISNNKNSAVVSPSTVYRLKQEIGPLTQSSAMSNVDETQTASAFNKLYGELSNKLDNTLKTSGFKDMLIVNKELSTATKLSEHLKRRAATSGGGKTLGFGELSGGTAGLVLSGGNPLGAAAGAALSKIARSNASQRVFNNMEGNLGNLLMGASKPVANNLLTKSVPYIGSGLMTVGGRSPEQPIQNNPLTSQLISPISTQATEVYPNGIQSDFGINNEEVPQTGGLSNIDPEQFKQVLVMGLLSGEIDPATANLLVELLGLDAPATNAVNKDQAQLTQVISELSRLYGLGTEDSISVGSSKGGIEKKIGSLGQVFKKATSGDFETKVVAYRNMMSTAAGIINKLRGAGTLNEGEYQVMMKNMPTENSTEEEAKQYFDNVIRMLGNSSISNPVPTTEEDIYSTFANYL